MVDIFVVVSANINPPVSYMVYQMPYKATTNWKFIQPHLPAKSRTTSRTVFHTCLATPIHCLATVTAC